MSEKSRPCAICGQPIDRERVEAVPETRLCTEHARRIAKYGGEFVLTATQASLGKSGSLKKNYGDVSVARSRNTAALAKLREEYERLSREKDEPRE
jgi:Prokaryotic dksA/traR C4-type zinc finger